MVLIKNITIILLIAILTYISLNKSREMKIIPLLINSNCYCGCDNPK